MHPTRSLGLPRFREKGASVALTAILSLMALLAARRPVSAANTLERTKGAGVRIVMSGLLLSLLLPFCLSSVAQADTLDRIWSTGKLVLGYREDAPPFSFKDESGAPAGFSVALCQKIAEEIKAELGLPGLSVEWSPVKVDDRTPAIQQGRIDLLCGADTDNLARRKDVSFSIPIYPSGIGAVVRADTSMALRDVLEGKPNSSPIWRGSPARVLEQKTFAIVVGTTAEKWLAERIQKFQISVNVVPVESYAAGVASLLDGKTDVFFGDRAIIMETAGQDITGGNLVALDRQFTNEPLALSLARDNDNLRLIVDETLSRLYPTPEFRDLYVKWFGAADASTLLFYQFSALPE